MSHGEKMLEELISQEIKKVSVSAVIWGKIDQQLNEISESLNKVIPGSPLVNLRTKKSLSITESLVNKLTVDSGSITTINVEDKGTRERTVYLTAGRKNIKICDIVMSETASEFRVGFNKKKIRYESVEQGFINFAKELLMTDGLIASVMEMKNIK